MMMQIKTSDEEIQVLQYIDKKPIEVASFICSNGISGHITEGTLSSEQMEPSCILDIAKWLINVAIERQLDKEMESQL